MIQQSSIDNYRKLIQWSDEHHCYVVFFPDFQGLVNQPCTDGITFEEAARNGQDCLETIVDYLRSKSHTLPTPQTYQTPIVA
jgi:antitoxin HicB